MPSTSNDNDAALQMFLQLDVLAPQTKAWLEAVQEVYSTATAFRLIELSRQRVLIMLRWTHQLHERPEVYFHTFFSDSASPLSADCVQLILEGMQQLLQQTGFGWALAYPQSSFVERYFEAANVSVVNHYFDMRIEPAQINHALIHKLAAKTDEIKIKIRTKLPGNRLEQWVNLLNQGYLDQVYEQQLPYTKQLAAQDLLLENQFYKTLGGGSLYAEALNEAGQTVGVSGVHHVPNQPIVEHSAMVVREDVRNRRLGYRLKAHLLRAMYRANPNFGCLRTYNAVGNSAMLHINEQLGYRPISDTTGAEFLIKRTS